MNKKVWTIISGVALVLLVGSGAFYGGMVFERSREANVQAAFFAQRSGGLGRFGGGDHQSGSGDFMQWGDHAGDQNAIPGQGGFGRGAAGTVKSIEGDTLLLSTPQDVTTVILTEQTTIIRFVAGERDDLQSNQRVTVIGQRSESGEVTATTIQIRVEEP